MSALLDYFHFLAHMPATTYLILAMCAVWIVLRVIANRRIKTTQDTVWTIADDQPRALSPKIEGPRYCYICKTHIEDESLSKCPGCGFEI
jgi:hypothetical protein